MFEFRSVAAIKGKNSIKKIVIVRNRGLARLGVGRAYDFPSFADPSSMIRRRERRREEGKARKKRLD